MQNIFCLPYHFVKSRSAKRQTFFTWLLIVSCLFGRAQTVSLNFQNAPIEKAFTEITKQTGFSFIYTRAQVKNAKPVTVKASNISLKSALDLCFANQPLSFLLEEKHVVVRDKIEKKPEQPIQEPQRNEVTGRVLNTSGEPVAGVTITIKGTSVVSLSDERGFFSFADVPDKSVLLFTHVAYEPNQLIITRAGYYELVLAPQISNLDETIVMAYGSTTKRMNTGNIGKISATQIGSQPVMNPLAAMQGRIPGLVITQTSGIPGAAFKVEIRGRTAIDLNISKNDPLYIIDGVPFEMANTPTNLLTSAANNPTSTSEGGFSALSMINTQDIESIEVLKDADATAIYGSRGANGVILITTKSGHNQKLTFNLRLNAGFSRVTRLMKMLNTQQYVEMRKEAFRNDGITPTITNAPDIMLWDTTRNTDIQKILAGGTAKYNEAQLSFSGGNQQTSFLFGAGFHNETTVLPGDLSNTRVSVNSNLNHSMLNKRFSFSLKTIYSHANNKIIAYDPSQYFYIPPNIILYDSNGHLAWQQKGVSFSSLGIQNNPLALLNEMYKSSADNLSANLNMKLKLVKGLFLKGSIGYNILRTDESSQKPTSSIDPASSLLPSAMFGNAVSKSWIAEPQLEYLSESPKTKLIFLLGTTFQNREFNGTSISGEDYTNDLLLSSIAAAGRIEAANYFNQYRYTALFGRIFYSYLNKYLLNLTARRDGSSRFGPEKRFANFGAMGGAWIFTNEEFFKNNISWLSFGKLRLSYGVSGNDQIGDYKFYDLWNNTPLKYQGVSGIIPVGLFNPNYEWESNRKREMAGEFGFFKERITLSVSYYTHRSSNQLVNFNLPRQTGFSSVVKNLQALVQNSGLEINLSATLIKRNLSSLVSSFNLTIPKNKLISFPGLSQSSYYLTYVEGYSLNVIRRYKYLGVDPITGVYNFEDVNNDGLFTSNKDYQILGDRDPKFYGGWQNTFYYKGFELSFLAQFVKQTGNNYLSSVSRFYPGRAINQPEVVLDRWTQEGDIKTFQKYTTTSSSPAAIAASTRLNLSNGVYSDASFIRLKTISIAYDPTFNLSGWSSKMHLKLFVSGQNLITLTNFKGADPESQNYFQLPPLKTLAFGIQLAF